MAESKMIFIILLIQTFVGVWSQSPECRYLTNMNHLYEVSCGSITDFSFITAYLNSSDIKPNKLTINYSSGLVLKREDFDSPMFSEICRFSYDLSKWKNSHPKILMGLPNLTELHFFGNSIASIPGGMFEGLSQLQDLEIRANYLTSIGNESFANLINLIDLNLEFNTIDRIDEGAFRSNNKLLSLNLEHNLLTSFDSRVLEGTKLINLYLTGNYFENISQVVLNISTLEILQMKYCKIISIPLGFFNNLPNLKLINLDRNVLTTIPAGLFTPLSHLRRVSIDDNSLSSMNVDTFQQFYTIMQGPEVNASFTEVGHGVPGMEPTINIYRNPWNCITSDMKQLRQWSEEREVNFTNIFQCQPKTKITFLIPRHNFS